MSNALVSKSVWVYRGSDGGEATVRLDDAHSQEESDWSTVDALLEPVVNVGSELWLDDGRKIRFPFSAQPKILPDQTGVVVIFDDGKRKYTHPDGTDVFPAPNNAAIYNADGSLRFQLRFASRAVVNRIAGVHSGAIVSPKFKGMMGVVVASHPEAQPEWVYVIDPSQPELISTGQWVRW